MNERGTTDALIREWLELEAIGRAPDTLFEHVFTTTASARQRKARPRWAPRLTFPGVRRVGLLVAAAMAALVLIFVGLLAGGRPAVVQPTPSPFSTPSQATTPSPRAVQPLASLSVGVSTGAAHLVATDGTTLWVSTDAAIVGVDSATSTIRTRLAIPPAAFSSAIAASPGAIWLAAPDAHPLSVSRYSMTTGALVASVPVPDALWPVVADGAIWVAEQSGGTVVRVDPVTNKVVASIATGGTSLGDMAPTTGAVWVLDASHSTLDGIATATNRITATVRISGAYPSEGALTVGDGAFWLTGSPVRRIDARTGQASTAAPAFGQSIGTVLVHPDAVWVAFASQTAPGTGLLLALDPTSGLPIDALSIPDGEVTGVAEAFGSVWLLLGRQGLVERFPPDLLTLKQ